jgi:hypothetical protein
VIGGFLRSVLLPIANKNHIGFCHVIEEELDRVLQRFRRVHLSGGHRKKNQSDNKMRATDHENDSGAAAALRG